MCMSGSNLLAFVCPECIITVTPSSEEAGATKPGIQTGNGTTTLLPAGASVAFEIKIDIESTSDRSLGLREMPVALALTLALVLAEKDNVDS